MAEFTLGTHPQRWEDVKICTCAMCKNEVQYVESWLKNLWGDGHRSDYICVLDTGSTDGTYEKLFEVGKQLNIPEDRLIICQKTFTPWRFDISRNYGMQFMPDEHTIDVCYSVDMDEEVLPDFWNDLRHIVFEHPNFERIYYKYAWRIDDGTLDQKYVFWYDKIHGVKGWKWEYPVHETLTCDCPELYSGKYSMDENKVYLFHHPDKSKSRGNYLPLLELRAEENPADLYGQYYLAREYGFHDIYDKAVFWDLKLYTRILSDPNNENVIEVLNDRSMLPCIITHLAKSLYRCGFKDDAELYFKKAISTNNTYREAYIKYAQMLAYSGRSADVYKIIEDMDRDSIEIDDWREPKWLWSSWKRTQILADAKSWEGKYQEAFDMMSKEESMLDASDREDATREGFFYDLEFMKNKVNNG